MPHRLTGPRSCPVISRLIAHGPIRSTRRAGPGCGTWMHRWGSSAASAGETTAAVVGTTTITTSSTVSRITTITAEMTSTITTTPTSSQLLYIVHTTQPEQPNDVSHAVKHQSTPITTKPIPAAVLEAVAAVVPVVAVVAATTIAVSSPPKSYYIMHNINNTSRPTSHNNDLSTITTIAPFTLTPTIFTTHARGDCYILTHHHHPSQH